LLIARSLENIEGSKNATFRPVSVFITEFLWDTGKPVTVEIGMAKQCVSEIQVIMVTIPVVFYEFHLRFYLLEYFVTFSCNSCISLNFFAVNPYPSSRAILRYQGSKHCL